MSDRGFPAASDVYPEKRERRPSVVEKVLRQIAYLPQRLLVRAPARSSIARIRQQAAACSVDAKPELQALRYELRRVGLRDELVLRALALGARQMERQSGIKPSDQQLSIAWLLVRGGRCVEAVDMDSWALASALAAMTVALAGVPVHVIVTTAHIAKRDAELMRPLIESFGLVVGIVDENTQEADRRNAYAADIAYCVHREIALDYLRDRMVLKGRPRALRLRTEALTSHNPRTRHLMLRGLQFAIVSEAETILVDAAQTPISISGDASASQEAAWLGQALQLARTLTAGSDYQLHEGRFVQVTEAGRDRLASAARNLAGLWQGAKRREDTVRLALLADRVLNADEHYQVAGQSLKIGDEVLRLHAPEPGSGRLLRMLLEIKEGCGLTGTREILARIGYQRFFRRYLRCAGLASNASNLGAELWSVYGLRLVSLPASGPRLDVRLPDRIFGEAKQAAIEILARVRDLRTHGCPVFIATRTPQAAAAWSEMLEKEGIANQCLKGIQDADEASAFAQLAAPGRVTVAPYFCARGTRVSTSSETGKLGGLRVIVAQLLVSPRHLQALVERSVPHGNSGSVQRMLALNDDLIMAYIPGWARRLPLKTVMLRCCQWLAVREQVHARGELLRVEDYVGDVLAFSGGPV